MLLKLDPGANKLTNLRISQRRFLLDDDLWEQVDLEVEEDDCEHKEVDEADLHRNKLQ